MKMSQISTAYQEMQFPSVLKTKNSCNLHWRKVGQI